MKNNLFRNFFIMAALILAVASSCKKDEEVDELEFELALPFGWNYQAYDDPVIRYYAWSPERTLDDEAGINDTINEDILISKQAFANSNLDGFYGALIDVYMDDPTFYEISVVDTTINGVDAKKMVHFQTVRIPIISTTVTTDSADLDIMPTKYLFYRNGNGYVVDCGALIYTFDYYKPVFEDIMSSFKFLN